MSRLFGRLCGHIIRMRDDRFNGRRRRRFDFRFGLRLRLDNRFDLRLSRRDRMRRCGIEARLQRRVILLGHDLRCRRR